MKLALDYSKAVTNEFILELTNELNTLRCQIHRRRKVKNIGGAKGGPNPQQAHDVVLTSMRRNDVTSTSFRSHVPPVFLINQCQIITFLTVKSDNIEIEE